MRGDGSDRLHEDSSNSFKEDSSGSECDNGLDWLIEDGLEWLTDAVDGSDCLQSGPIAKTITRDRLSSQVTHEQSWIRAIFELSS